MTASTDRELLELAAKAAGIEGYEWDETPFDRGLVRRNFEDCGLEIQTQSFNSLDVDGDALRLAVKLKLDVYHYSLDNEPHVSVHDCYNRNGGSIELYGDDANAATRRAITRAAAAIGEAML